MVGRPGAHLPLPSASPRRAAPAPPGNAVQLQQHAADAVLSFIESLPAPAIAVDACGIVLLVNAALRERRHLDERACTGTLAERFPEYEGALRGTPRWLTPQRAHLSRRGEVDTVHECVTVRAIPGGACLFIDDITATRQMESANAQTLRLASLGFMLAGASHEMSNPLAAIYSMVQLLRANPQADRPDVQKGLAHISHNVHRMLEISERLCGFARVDEEVAVEFSIDEVVDESLALLEQSGQLASIELVREPDPSARVSGKAGELREVFHNILLNAVQAMDGRGRLLVRTARTRPGEVEIAFHDTGPGIPPAAMPRLFEPFFTTRRNGKGTGLGLSISNEIVNEHGGRIRGANDARMGAWFFVDLPLAGTAP